MPALSRYLLLLALFLLGAEAFAGTTITKIAQCKDLKIEAETDLKRTTAVEIYVNYGRPLRLLNYNEFGEVIYFDKGKNAIELRQTDLPTTHLNLSTQRIVVTSKGGHEQNFAECRFNRTGIKALKSTTARLK